jgi:hypothetical protein
VASASTDANGGQELSFTSSSSAFQVQAGDQMANALMGNFSSGSTGAAIQTTVTGGSAAASGTAFPNPTAVTVQIVGAGLVSPVSLSLNSNDTTVDAAIDDLTSQVSKNASLQAAGIAVSGSPGGSLVFTSATGETFSVQSTVEVLKFPSPSTFLVSPVVSEPYYSSITAGNVPSITDSGITRLGFSLDGGPAGGAGPTIAGTALTTVNTYAMNSELQLVVNGKSVAVNFSNDPNNSQTESVANVSNYINSTVDAVMGWTSDVKIASVNANNGITLAGTVANAGSTLQVQGSTASQTLGLTPLSSGTVSAAPPQAANWF